MDRKSFEAGYLAAATHGEPPSEQLQAQIDSAYENATRPPQLRSHRGLPVLRLTRRELEALPEYSTSVPTGTTPGKRWRRNVAFSLAGFHPPTEGAVWIVGEYGKDVGGYTPITWYDVEVT